MLKIKEGIYQDISGNEETRFLLGKVVLQPMRSENKSIAKMAIFGALAGEEQIVHEENEQGREMWEVEIIINPIRKYSGKDEDGNTTPLVGRELGGIYSEFGYPDNWGKKYFDLGEL